MSCRLCWGYQCGPEPESTEPGSAFSAELSDFSEPVSHLTVIPAAVLNDHVDPVVAEILGMVWRGHNGMPGREPNAGVDIVGKVRVGQESRDFTLSIAQNGSVQAYALAIDDFASVDLTLETREDRVHVDLTEYRPAREPETRQFSFEPGTQEVQRTVIQHWRN